MIMFAFSKLAVACPGLEKRVDPADGKDKTLDAFMDAYHGLDEWDECTRITRHSEVVYKDKGDGWKLKNSWGDDFGSGGYHYVSKEAMRTMEGLFIDVSFLTSDLLPRDHDRFRDHKRRCDGCPRCVWIHLHTHDVT